MTAFHAVPSGRAYAIRKTGGKRAVKAGMSRTEAWREARRLARCAGTKAYLFGADGRIATRIDYGAHS